MLFEINNISNLYKMDYVTHSILYGAMYTDMKIHLSVNIVKKCRQFAIACAPKERPLEYGEKDAHVRDISKIETDTFIGKLGECAIKDLFHQYGINSSIDFSIMERGKWDVDDLSINDWRFDVKCTQKGKNFLIEWNKLQFRLDNDELPHFFLMTRISEDFNGDIDDGIDVECIGFVETRNLREDNPKVQIKDKGENIPGTEYALTTKNFCVPFQNLDKDWRRLCHHIMKEKPYSFQGYQLPGTKKIYPVIKKENEIEFSMKYSILLSGTFAIKAIKENKVESWIFAGIKVLLFLHEKERALIESLTKKNYGREHLMVFYTKGILPNLEIRDGQMDTEAGNKYKKLTHMSMQPMFNFEQYEVEHADTKSTMIVKASAGTGKTTVMIDRILFLLSTQSDLHLADIGMITFTNKATHAMIEKIQNRLMDMEQLLDKKDHKKSEKYHKWLEELSDMRISTIDSFFKEVISKEGSTIGYGESASIRSFTYEKKKILKDVIDDMFQKEKEQEPDADILSKNILSIQDYVKHAFWMWNEFNSRGYFQDNIYTMDFGDADASNNIVNQKLKSIIAEAERRYQLFKRQHNAFTVSDIKADMDALSRTKERAQRHHPYRFLFVDEFQDTDDSQIRSIAWLKQSFNSQLFVVGDIKQSIYRFRGAEESAFDALIDELRKNSSEKINIKSYFLTKNYRTSANVMNEFNRVFSLWGKDSFDCRSHQKLLDWEQDVISCISEKGKISISYCKKNKEVENFIINSIKSATNEIIELRNKDKKEKKENKLRVIAFLCRSNNNVKNVAEVCHKAGIPCQAKLQGGFYQSQPVRDLHAVLAFLLYPEEPTRIFNLLMTPYSRVLPDMKALVSQNGNRNRILDYFKSLLECEGWTLLLRNLRVKPFFIILQDIIDREPVKQYRERLKEKFVPYQKNALGDLKQSVELYQLNLNKLMEILYSHFSGEYASVLDVFQFLDNKIKTEKKEDLVYPEPDKNEAYAIEAMTVHKAKGLEFDTVILPYTWTPFVQTDRREVITDKKKRPTRVGWKFSVNHRIKGSSKYDTKTILENNYYLTMEGEERAAVRREEARLLYVAMTRTMRHLKVLLKKTEDSFDNTWAEYISDLKKVDMNEKADYYRI